MLSMRLAAQSTMYHGTAWTGGGRHGVWEAQGSEDGGGAPVAVEEEEESEEKRWRCHGGCVKIEAGRTGLRRDVRLNMMTERRPRLKHTRIQDVHHPEAACADAVMPNTHRERPETMARAQR